MSASRRYGTAVALSSGGTAEVYKAWDERLGRHVALKFLRRDDPTLVERMFREARAQARLDHDGICQVYDVGELDGRPYIAMQYVDGVELGEIAGSLTLEEKVQVMLRVTEAVHYAHQEGLIHRDLKPSNIMVQRGQDGRLRPVVVDFGLVHEHLDPGTAVTQAGQVLGTPPYLAPEQVEGRRDRLDRRTDVYGLGSTFYELFTGQPPFLAERGVDLLIQTLHDEPRPPRRLEPSLPADLETITLKCLEKEPARRYPSARALGQDLRRFLDGEPIQARPASLGYRLSKKVRKHRSGMVAAVIFLLIAIAGLFVVRWRADLRLHYEQRFANIGRDVEWSLRAVHMSAKHDITPSKARVREQIEELEAELEDLGSIGRPPAHFAIGRAYAALGQDAEAHRHLESAWQLGYRKPEVGHALGLVVGRLYEDGLLRARRQRDSEERRLELQRLDRELGKKALDYLAAGRGAESASTDHVEALLAFYGRRYQDALDSLARARASHPWLFETYIVEGRVFSHMGEDAFLDRGDVEAARRFYRQAEAAFESAIASAPSSPAAFANLCHTVSQRLRLDFQNPSPTLEQTLQSARLACETAIEIDGELPEARIRHAQLYRSWARHQAWSGEDPLATFERGLESAQRAVELAPASPLAHSTSASILAQRAEHRTASRSGDPRDDLEQAARLLERALELQPRDGFFLNQLGGVWRIRGTYEARNGHDAEPSADRAVDYYRQAVAAAPTLFARHHNLGNAYLLKCHVLFRRGEQYGACLEAMAASYRKAIELNPEFDWSHTSLGASFGMQADRALILGHDPEPLVSEALAWSDQAIELNPGVAEFYFWRSTHHNRRALYALMRGEDPAPHLEASRAQVLEGAARDPSRPDEPARLLEIDALAIRAAMRFARPHRRWMDRGDRTVETLRSLGSRDSYFYSSVTSFLLWSAAAEIERGARPAERLEHGLRVAGEAIAKNILVEEFLGRRGALRFLESQLSGSPDERRRLLEAAEGDLSEALRRNRWLSLELDPWLSKVRQALDSGPRVEDDVS